MSILMNELNSFTPSESDRSVAEAACRSLAVRLSKAKSFRLELGDRGEALSLPESAVKLLLRAMAEMAQGNAVSVVPIQAELSTQQAAELLGVSRPYLVKLLDDGMIPSRKVGTHRRVLSADVLNYKSDIDAKRLEALDELTALSQELKLGY